MRLLTIRVNWARYGAENHMMRVARGAAASGLDVHAAFPQGPETGSLIRDCRASNITFWPFEWTTREPAYRRYLKTLALLKRARPDVVQFTAGSPREVLVPSLACALHGVPLLAVFQSAETQALPDWQVRAAAWARARRQRWSAVSGYVSSNLQSTFKASADDIGVLINGIEIPPLADETETETIRNDVRRELGLSDTDMMLLTTGRVTPLKGHDDLLAIAPKLIERFPRAVFVWLGDGSGRDDIERRVRREGIAHHVRFLGYRNDVDRFVRAADLFLFPSHTEGGCSSSIREVMVGRLPIVCSDAGGIPEVLDDGVHALVFPAKDQGAMLERLCYALNHPEEMRVLAERARDRIQDFSADRMVSDYLATFHEMVTHRA